MTPFESSRRVFVLERADTLIDQAANKLLKTLEEPASFVHLILLTDRLGEVLPTIRSRCQLVRFDALGPEQLAERLGRHGVAARAGGGLRAALARRRRAGAGAGARRRPGAAGRRRGARARGARAGRSRARRGASCWRCASGAATRRSPSWRRGSRRSRSWPPRASASGVETEYTERTRRTRRRVETGALDLGLQLAALWLRDVACVAGARRTLVHHVDRAGELRDDAEGRDPQRLRAAVELVEETRRRLRSNVTEELALETLAYRLEALLAA